MVLRQHAPLIAVLDSAPNGGFYENRRLSTGCLWITAQKKVLFAMVAYKTPLLDFFVQGLAIFTAKTLCQATLLEAPTRAVYHFVQNRMCGLHKPALHRLEQGLLGFFEKSRGFAISFLAPGRGVTGKVTGLVLKQPHKALGVGVYAQAGAAHRGKVGYQGLDALFCALEQQVKHVLAPQAGHRGGGWAQ